MITTFIQGDIYSYLILPLLIFIARICDVTIGTMRIIFVSKGHRKIAPFMGFFEVLIWILAISQIMTNLNNWVCYIAYAGGFATGNYIGMLVEERLAVGTLIIRIVTNTNGEFLAKKLNQEGFGTTLINAEGSSGKVDIIYSIFARNDLNAVLSKVNEFNPKAFYSIEDVRKVNSGIFTEKVPLSGVNFLHRWRKGK